MWSHGDQSVRTHAKRSLHLAGIEEKLLMKFAAAVFAQITIPEHVAVHIVDALDDGFAALERLDKQYLRDFGPICGANGWNDENFVKEARK